MLTVLLFCILFPVYGCGEEPKLDDIEKAPSLTDADKKYADVFRILDGRWVGLFEVLVDENDRPANLIRPESFDEKTLNDLALKQEMVIDVEQIYESDSPYFQRVIIRDTYLDASGKTKTVESRGVNKIQNGEMWCVVKKPDETVIHKGTLADSHTIIWQRDIRNPLKIEYFRETVLADEYSILGWGYYGNTDPDSNPTYWFRAVYRRAAD